MEIGSLAYFSETLSGKIENSNFNDISWIPDTSNSCERLFSITKQTATPQRGQLTSMHLEGEQYLKINKNFWSVNTVNNMLCNSDNAKK